MHHAVRLAIVVLSLLALSVPARAIDPAGKAVDVDPQAVGTLEGTAGLTLASGDSVFVGQTIVTGSSGQVQIVFSDNTHLVIGPDATLVISEYLMRNDGSVAKFIIDALSGTFRFLTGNSDKEAYAVETPTGTIAVRGTAFDFTVDPVTQATTLLLYHGGVSMCGEANNCASVTEACGIGQLAKFTPSSVVGHADRQREPLIAKFRYLASQEPLMPGFRIAGAAPCAKTEAAVLSRTDAPSP